MKVTWCCERITITFKHSMRAHNCRFWIMDVSLYFKRMDWSQQYCNARPLSTSRCWSKCDRTMFQNRCRVQTAIVRNFVARSNKLLLIFSWLYRQRDIDKVFSLAMIHNHPVAKEDYACYHRMDLIRSLRHNIFTNCWYDDGNQSTSLSWRHHSSLQTIDEGATTFNSLCAASSRWHVPESKLPVVIEKIREFESLIVDTLY